MIQYCRFWKSEMRGWETIVAKQNAPLGEHVGSNHLCQRQKPAVGRQCDAELRSLITFRTYGTDSMSETSLPIYYPDGIICFAEWKG